VNVLVAGPKLILIDPPEPSLQVMLAMFVPHGAVVVLSGGHVDSPCTAGSAFKAHFTLASVSISWIAPSCHLPACWTSKVWPIIGVTITNFSASYFTTSNDFLVTLPDSDVIPNCSGPFSYCFNPFKTYSLKLPPYSLVIPIYLAALQTDDRSENGFKP